MVISPSPLFIYVPKMPTHTYHFCLHCIDFPFLLLTIKRILPYSSVQSLSCVQLFATPWTAVPPWTAGHQASLSITNSWSLLKLMSIESVMPSNHFILCHPLLLLPSIFPSIRVFSNESVLRIRWPKYWSFSFSISPSNEYSGLISFIFSFIYLFIYFWPHRASQGILVPQPGIKPVTPMSWKCGILTTRLPGKSLS